MITRQHLTRRAFVASLLSSGVANGALAGAAAKPRRKIKYIDIHTHLGTFYWGKELTVGGLLNLMDRHDIERAVVLPLVSPESSPYPQTSEAALAAYKAHPDRLIPFCAVDPRVTPRRPERVGHLEGVKRLVGLVERDQDAGPGGVGARQVGPPV